MLDSSARITQPLTGAEYLESLRDRREVYVYGERVTDVTTHPAFRNTARSIARLYDALYDPVRREVITTPTDTGSDGVTHKFFRYPRTVEDCVGDLEAIAEWARLGYGWLGRSPDYKAAFLATLGANADFYHPYQDNARRWYREAQERVLYWNHAIIHPPVDRNRPPEEVSDVFMHVESERDDGIVVSGAKVVATGSALTHFNFIAHYGPIPVQKKEYALVCAVSMDTPGVKLICRPSYEMTAEVMGTPFDYPLSSRLDENDAIFIFDQVLVPWENVFVYGDTEKANNFFPQTGFIPASASTAASGSPSSSTSSAACSSRRWRRPAPRTSAASRPRSAKSSLGATSCGASPAPWPASPSPGKRARCCPTWTTRWPIDCSPPSATRV